MTGDGPPVLVLHGSGGGYDQGEILAQAALGDGFCRITPSRFGYLRSTFCEGATFDDQAHAYASLLDHLGIEAVAVVAVSHGGPSALLLAALHPERVRSLTLLSCGVAPSTAADQAAAHRKGTLLTVLFRHDLAFRIFSRVFRRSLMRLMGADDAVVARLNAEERRSVEQIINCMEPVSTRAAGVAFDNTAALPGRRIAAVRAPTLIVHARDDRLQLYHNAEYAARTIPNARLVSYDHGGHLLLAVEQSSLRRLVREHVEEHARGGGDP